MFVTTGLFSTILRKISYINFINLIIEYIHTFGAKSSLSESEKQCNP